MEELEQLREDNKNLKEQRDQWERNYGELYYQKEWLEKELEKSNRKNKDRGQWKQEIEKVISQGLRRCINDHGPVSKELIGSAAKRIASQLEANGYRR